MYHPGTARGAQVPRASGSSCTNTRVPGGPIGVRLKSNTPLSCAYAESFGLMRDPRNKFRVVRAWGKRRSHRRNGSSGSVLQRMAIKWFLKVRIARSAALRRCLPASVSCKIYVRTVERIWKWVICLVKVIAIL